MCWLCTLIHSFQPLSHVQLFATSWIAARQASLSITNSGSLLKLVSIGSVMPSNHLILYWSPSPPAFNLYQHQGLFQWVSFLLQVAKVLKLQHQSFQRIFSTLRDHHILSNTVLSQKENISENQLFLHSLPNLCWGLIAFLAYHSSSFFVGYVLCIEVAQRKFSL